MHYERDAVSTKTSDHYVPATYLRQFIDPRLKGGRTHVFRKRTGQCTPQLPNDICKIRGGDLNKYFEQADLLRDYLRPFENTWSSTIGHMLNGQNDADDHFFISGMMAYIKHCCPTTKRLGGRFLEQQLEDLRPLLARHVQQEMIGGDLADHVADALLDGGIRINVDFDFARALAMRSMTSTLARIFTGSWRILMNDTELPFVTTDFPVCNHYWTENDVIGTVYFPLAPQIAVTIEPSTDEVPEPLDVRRLRMGPVEYLAIQPRGVELFNSLLIQSAEDQVITRKQYRAFTETCRAFSDWRMECIMDKIPFENGFYQVVRLRPRRNASNKSK